MCMCDMSACEKRNTGCGGNANRGRGEAERKVRTRNKLLRVCVGEIESSCKDMKFIRISVMYEREMQVSRSVAFGEVQREDEMKRNRNFGEGEDKKSFDIK